MDANQTSEAPASNWLSLIDRLGPLLKVAKAEDRILIYLREVRAHFGWPVAEHWVLGRDDGYRISHESHADSEPLNRFERESASVVVPRAWVRPDRWRLDPTVTESVASRVFWRAEAP